MTIATGTFYRYLGPPPLPAPMPGDEMRVIGRRSDDGTMVEMSCMGQRHWVPLWQLEDPRAWKRLDTEGEDGS